GDRRSPGAGWHRCLGPCPTRLASWMVLRRPWHRPPGRRFLRRNRIANRTQFRASPATRAACRARLADGITAPDLTTEQRVDARGGRYSGDDPRRLPLVGATGYPGVPGLRPSAGRPRAGRAPRAGTDSMKLLLDTCVWGGALAELQAAGHDVIWAGNWDEDPG